MMGLRNVIEEQIPLITAPRVQIFWIEGAGHMLHLTHADEVAKRMAHIRGMIVA